MESVERSLHRRKLSNANGGCSLSAKNAYSDVFFSGGRGGGEGTPKDYAEIFGGTRGSSSIPVLDLSAIDDGRASEDFSSSKVVDYSHIFGGFVDEEVAFPYEDLFVPAKTCNASCAKAPGISMQSSGPSSIPNKVNSSEASDFSTGGTRHINTSYQKNDHRTDDGENGTYKAQCQDAPGLTHLIDETANPSNPGGNKPTNAVDYEIFHNRRSSRDSYEGENEKKAKARIPEKVAVRSNIRTSWDGSYWNDKLFHISEINLKSHFSRAPPPQCPLTNNTKDHAEQSKCATFPKAGEENLSPFSDEEFDLNPAAAASIAVLREAIEKAQESIRLAKELMDRKKEGCQSNQRPSYKLNSSAKSKKNGQSDCEFNHNIERKAEKSHERSDIVLDASNKTVGNIAVGSDVAPSFNQGGRISLAGEPQVKKHSINLELPQENRAETWVPELVNDLKCRTSTVASHRAEEKTSITLSMDDHEHNHSETKTANEVCEEREEIVSKIEIAENDYETGNADRKQNGLSELKGAKGSAFKMDSAHIIDEHFPESSSSGVDSKVSPKEEKGVCKQGSVVIGLDSFPKYPTQNDVEAKPSEMDQEEGFEQEEREEEIDVCTSGLSTNHEKDIMKQHVNCLPLESEYNLKEAPLKEIDPGNWNTLEDSGKSWARLNELHDLKSDDMKLGWSHETNEDNMSEKNVQEARERSKCESNQNERKEVDENVENENTEMTQNAVESRNSASDSDDYHSGTCLDEIREACVYAGDTGVQCEHSGTLEEVIGRSRVSENCNEGHGVLAKAVLEYPPESKVEDMPQMAGMVQTVSDNVVAGNSEEAASKYLPDDDNGEDVHFSWINPEPELQNEKYTFETASTIQNSLEGNVSGDQVHTATESSSYCGVAENFAVSDVDTGSDQREKSNIKPGMTNYSNSDEPLIHERTSSESPLERKAAQSGAIDINAVKKWAEENTRDSELLSGGDCYDDMLTCQFGETTIKEKERKETEETVNNDEDFIVKEEQEDDSQAVHEEIKFAEILKEVKYSQSDSNPKENEGLTEAERVVKITERSSVSVEEQENLPEKVQEKVVSNKKRRGWDKDKIAVERAIRDHVDNGDELLTSSGEETERTIEEDETFFHEEEKDILHVISEGRKWVEHQKEMESSQLGSRSRENEESDGTVELMENENEGTTVTEKSKELEENLEKVEASKRRKEWDKNRVAVERAIREARERAFAEARERAERAAVERATVEARQRAIAETREKLEKASAANKTPAEKAFERAAVERATAEARERALEKALSQKSSTEARSQAQRMVVEKFSGSSKDNGMRHSFSSSDLERYDGTIRESAQRRKARLERHQRIMERAGKALAEKNKRDLLAQKEQAERNRLAETLDSDIKRWASGKEGNLRALLSTLQYILGPNSGWQPISLTEIVTTSAVRKAYRKATLHVHPDKLQQRGASIQQKYICEKVFDLLKAAWNRFNSEER